jgi:hypothetical protein
MWKREHDPPRANGVIAPQRACCFRLVRHDAFPAVAGALIVGLLLWPMLVLPSPAFVVASVFGVWGLTIVLLAVVGREIEDDAAEGAQASMPGDAVDD